MFDAGGIRIGYMLRSASMLVTAALDAHNLFDVSIGELICHPAETLKHFAMVDMNNACDRWIIPISLFLEILMPSSLSGSPRSWISKLPLIPFTILSIAHVLFMASSPSSTYHPAISIDPSWLYLK